MQAGYSLTRRALMMCKHAGSFAEKSSRCFPVLESRQEGRQAIISTIVALFVLLGMTPDEATAAAMEVFARDVENESNCRSCTA